jgi:outer membrane protein assembly factor BamB
MEKTRNKKEMRKLYCKTKFSTIALILMLIFSLFIIYLPAVNAQDVETYPYLAIFPNPVGVDQVAVVNMWVQPLQPAEYDIYHGFTLTVTKPDGSTEDLGTFDSDPTGATWTQFIPDMAGTYTFQFSYPGETFTSTGEYYKPATSPPTELVVIQEPLPPYPTVPLPDDYWERPISGENREWYSISGNWLTDGYNSTTAFVYNSGTGWNPYSKAPRSSHIVWKKELLLGGLVGGEYGSTSYYTGNDYEAHVTPPIIINGRLYYRIYLNDFRTAIRPGIACVDLRTGEELWLNTEINVDVGQLYDYRSGNQMGVTPWLWDIGENGLFGGLHLPHTYKMYDAFTGDLILSFENAIQGGIPVFGKDGTLYTYFIDGVNNWLAMWNSTQAFEANGMISYGASGVGALRPSQPWWFQPNLKGTYDWNTGITWNVTIPDVPDYPDINFGGFLGHEIVSVMGDVLLVTLESFSHSYLEIGYDKNTGERLWIHDTAQWTWHRAFGQQVYADFYSPARTWIGHDVNTGTKLWESDAQEYPWGLYNGGNSLIAEDKLIATSYDGYVHAYDINTGTQVWKYYSEDTTETPYGTYPFYYGPIVADRVVFAGTGEHSPTQPLLRGLKLHAINADNGEGIWNIAGLFSPAAIADGYLVAYNGYDNTLYTFGKGPSAMTVEAPKTEVPKGTAVMITGTVTDQSAGAKGTPAISDEDMSAWMEYVYMQKPKPENAKGVTVKLYAVDSNDVYHDIGETTSDVWGNFGESWVPPAEDDYQIIAEFEGSNSYGESSASTYLTVGPALTPETPITPEPEPSPLITTEVAIILAVVAVAVIAIVGYWILKKRQ